MAKNLRPDTGEFELLWQRQAWNFDSSQEAAYMLSVKYVVTTTNHTWSPT